MKVNVLPSGITHFSPFFYRGLTPDLLGQYLSSNRTRRPTMIMFLDFSCNGFLLAGETKLSKKSQQILRIFYRNGLLIEILNALLCIER